MKDQRMKVLLHTQLQKLESGVNRVTKFTKPAKNPTWTKDMSLETYNMQLAILIEINEDVLEYVKYNDLIE